MEFERMKIVPLEDNLWLLDDNGDSSCYLVCGTERAMLIDTCNGYEDLNAIVRTITDLPLVVVNTHGHGDHIYGNVYFDEAWMHPDDFDLAAEFFSYAKEEMDKHGLKPCPLKPLAYGQQFDLGGGTVLEVIPLRGHTRGSVALLDRKRRIIFTGDGTNPHLWMQLDHSAGISVLAESVEAVIREHGGEFDRVLFGHCHDSGIDAVIFPQVLAACRKLLAGEVKHEGDPAAWTYKYFAGECFKYQFGETEHDIIVYQDIK
ncbi:MAG: MBL fold metallo-hydrolase [Ruminococcaceae bacterium]|nr:MBL fold metallo-hydrolase [Oscillospiraceae bacterium]